MKIVKNICLCDRGLPGIGTLKPGQSVTVDDSMGMACATSPDVFEVTGIEEIKPAKIKANIKEKLGIKIKHASDDLLEDVDNGSD